MKKILNEIWKNKLALLSAITILVLLFMFMALLKSNFFSSYTTADYINLFAPILSFFSIILIFFTLRESQRSNNNSKKFNENQLAMNEYNILLQDFELIKNRLENLKFSLKTKKTLSESFMKSIENSNGINYIDLFHDFLFKSYKTPFTAFTADDELSLNNSFRFDVIFPLLRNYNDLEIFINEVNKNDILNDRYKRKLYLKVEQQLLQHYFTVCNNENSTGKKDYDLTIFDTEGFNYTNIYKLNNLFIENGLFQIHDLDYYQKNS